MSGSDPTATNRDWYLLKDETTDETVGYIDTEGNTRETDAETTARVREAFDRDLIVQDDEVVDELGMCFDGVCSIGPADPGHDALVLRNLGALTGLRPEAPTEEVSQEPEE